MLEIAERCKIIRIFSCGWVFTSVPVNQVRDVNDKTNFAGAGINIAQRVLDCGDAGHILVSRHMAEDGPIPALAATPHDLGECEVKHGLRLRIVNLHKDNLGNPQVPEKLKRRRWKQASGAIRPISAPRSPKFALIAALLVSTIALVVSSLIFFHPRSRSPAAVAAPGAIISSAAAPIPEKSIAILPFENLSGDKENAYFTNGVQDEILTGRPRWPT